VHDLVARIDFVFESAEQNHLYLEGMLRESREELAAIAERLEALGKEKPR
jgi:DNA-binding ferritin-like protein